MRTLISYTAAFLLAVLLASSARGQPVEEPRPRFVIDSIRVTGLKYASERVIVAETRLQPGRSYTETELHSGAARAARLPFVVRIDLRLERGEARGAYQLLIDVTEAKPVFLGGTLRAGGDEDDDLKSAALGARLFAGRSGVLHGAASAGDRGGIEVGYTQYDLFGTGIFAAAILEYGDVATNETDISPYPFIDSLEKVERITTRLVAGIPIGGNHALRASWTHEPIVLRRSDSFGEEPFELAHVDTQELSYIYDSTDDPLFPSSGMSVVGTAALRSGPFILREPDLPTLRITYERPSFSVEARRHWRLTSRHSVSAGFEGRHVQRETQVPRFGIQTSRSDRYEVEAAYAFSIRGDDRPNRLGELRAEAGAGYATLRQRIPQPDFMPDQLLSDSTPTAFVGLVYRSQWAVFRLRFEAGEPRP